MLYSFDIIDIQGREIYLHDFVKYTCNTGLHLDTYKPICFKLGLILDLTNFYSFNDLDFPSRSQVVRNARTCAIILL